MCMHDRRLSLRAVAYNPFPSEKDKYVHSYLSKIVHIYFDIYTLKPTNKICRNSIIWGFTLKRLMVL